VKNLSESLGRSGDDIEVFHVHFRDVVCILALSDTCVYANERVGQGVDFKF